MTDIKLFNTAGKQLQSLHPVTPGVINFYHCGPTVYWNQHIGNFRGMTEADLMRRALTYLGYQVNYVRNYTDVGHLTGDNIGDADSGEDRMEKAVRREHLTPDAIADKYIAQFEADGAALNLLPPTITPRATHYVEQMQELVAELLAKSFAYTTDLAVYFDVSKAVDYTRLSGQKLELNQVGAGHGDIADSGKRHAQDFALWFFKTGAHAGALQTWESPFLSAVVENGRGFPGWHIECSAMAKAELGVTLDIHMGGVEHIPIHHTNEIAQSESANGQPYVNYWLHNEHLTVDGKKMSKSEGTSFLVADIAARGFSPLALRYFYLGAHYRSKQNFTWEALAGAATALERLQKQLTSLQQEAVNTPLQVPELYRLRFVEAIANDFNFPAALAVIWELLRSEVPAAEKLGGVLEFDQVLGLKLSESLAEGNASAVSLSADDETVLVQLQAQRTAARAAGDYATADALRAEIAARFGVEVKDTAAQKS